MKAILKKVEINEFTVKNDTAKAKKGQKFKKLEFTCDVIFGDNQVRTLTGSYSMDFAKEYSAEVILKTGKKIVDHVGQVVDVVVAKKTYEKEDKSTGIYQFIQFLNILDAEGKPIKMPKKDSEGNTVDL